MMCDFQDKVMERIVGSSCFLLDPSPWRKPSAMWWGYSSSPSTEHVWWETKTSLQQMALTWPPCKQASIKGGSSGPVKPEDVCSLGPNLDGKPVRCPETEPSTKILWNFWLTETVWDNKYYCYSKPVSFEVVQELFFGNRELISWVLPNLKVMLDSVWITRWAMWHKSYQILWSYEIISEILLSARAG